MGPQINIRNPCRTQHCHVPVIDRSCDIEDHSIHFTMFTQLNHKAHVIICLTCKMTHKDNMGTEMTPLLKIYSHPAWMCEEELYPGAAVVPGKRTNDSVWEDMHLWELSFVSLSFFLLDPLKTFSENGAKTVQQLQFKRQWCLATITP